MCGIAGFYGFRDDNLIKKISRELVHRGPDGEGLYIDNNVTLLNRRLAIIDIAEGDQPIYNEDKSIAVVYNGEIYNYRDLRKVLVEKGHKFSTQSDTEVIVHGYEQWQETCFDRLNGMFAIALYDKKKEKLILARDHFGIKPLYYTTLKPKIKNQKLNPQRKNQSEDKHNIFFSSEIKPLINSGLIERIPNDKIIYRYLRYRIHDDQKETFFKNIYRLMPGEMIIIDQQAKIRTSNGLKPQKFTQLEENLYQSLHLSKINKIDSTKINIFKKKLIEAIRLRLISEVPVGTCLSGGLDSSTVVAIVNKLLKQNVQEVASVGKIQKTFSAVFPGSTNDEEKFIDNLKFKSSNLKSFKIYPSPEKFIKEIREFIKIQEEPTISTGPYAQFKVMEKASGQVKVVLDGQGADEMMAGYIPYYFVYLRQLRKEKKYIELFKEIWGMKDIIIKYSINRLIEIIGIKKQVNIEKLLDNQFQKKFSGQKFNTVNDNLKTRLISDIFYNSLPALLRYEDKNSMKFSIEGRVPFLDINLISYIFSLSDESIIKNGWNKYILREATKNLLPEIIRIRRNKIGFTTPEYEWFLKLKNWIYSIYISQSFRKRKYFNQKKILETFQQFIEGKIEDTMVFWRMLNIELWLREFFDSQSNNYNENSYHKKKEFGANQGKKLKIVVDKKTYFRFPIKTGLFNKGDEYEKNIADYVLQWLNANMVKLFKANRWFVVVSEKIIAISQGRSYFTWEIKPSIWAKILSKFVSKTPFGIGLGSPWTMELAIREVGIIKIIIATIITAITKPLGIKGMFYRITGDTVRSIDGPTEYSLYPSNVSAKLGPKNPQNVVKEIDEKIVLNLKSQSFDKLRIDPERSRTGQNSNLHLKSKNFKNKIINYKLHPTNFLGTVIIDANDLGQNVLGNTTGLQNQLIERIFVDNPMGQSDEQTPITIVFEK